MAMYVRFHDETATTVTKPVQDEIHARKGRLHTSILYLDLLAIDDEVALVVLDSPVVHAVHGVVLEHCRSEHDNQQQNRERHKKRW